MIDWIKQHRRILLSFAACTAALFVIAQLLYPVDRLPLYSTIDGVNVSGWKKSDATWQLNHLSARHTVDVLIGDDTTTYTKVAPVELGVVTKHDKRVERTSYPWYLRLVPTSLLWYGFVQPVQPAATISSKTAASKFLNTKLGASCNIPPKNATLSVNNGSLNVEKAVDGGTCQQDEAVKAISSLKPELTKPSRLVIPVTVEKPVIQDAAAVQLKQTLVRASADGVKLKVNADTLTIDQKELFGWLTFSTKGNTLSYGFDSTKAAAWMNQHVSPKVTKAAGTTTITTYDFTETSRKNGAAGQALALDGTLADIKNVLEGSKDTASALVKSIPAKVSYSRSYSHTSTGLSALMTNYAHDHPGTFGVAFQELGGQNRSATYNSSHVFITASTFKLFVAYGTLKRIDAGKWKWTDTNISSGRNLSKCFDDMIVKSDNACAEALLKKIGTKTLTSEIQALGLKNSSFLHENIETTPNDLRSYLVMLQGGTLPVSSASRGTLLNAMKRNVYRQGIPAGASGQTADKVGFLWGLLHDAAVVYSPKGTYVLVIMTDGSTWANIADLTRQIESIR
jgi:beta-lactamase class A